MKHKVVAHFIDHAMVKGTSMDVDPGRILCHIETADRGTVEVDLRQVKALYFVKDFGGQPKYDETRQVSAGDQRLVGSRRVRVRFRDGEEQGGLMNRYPPNRPFYFLLPIDPASNNIRILINRDAVAEVTPVEDEQPPGSPPSETEANPAAQRPRRTTWVFDGKGIKNLDVG
ncbi:MAG TPA: hypothetical protein VF970_15045 [Gemmatimonadales bacterium]